MLDKRLQHSFLLVLYISHVPSVSSRLFSLICSHVDLRRPIRYATWSQPNPVPRHDEAAEIGKNRTHSQVGAMNRILQKEILGVETCQLCVFRAHEGEFPRTELTLLGNTLQLRRLRCVCAQRVCCATIKVRLLVIKGCTSVHSGLRRDVKP